jgi:hypothetical protein
MILRFEGVEAVYKNCASLAQEFLLGKLTHRGRHIQ